MSSAVHNLQMAIVEGKQSLTVIKADQADCREADLTDVEEWVGIELNGYGNDTHRQNFVTD